MTGYQMVNLNHARVTIKATTCNGEVITIEIPNLLFRDVEHTIVMDVQSDEETYLWPPSPRVLPPPPEEITLTIKARLERDHETGYSYTIATTKNPGRWVEQKEIEDV